MAIEYIVISMVIEIRREVSDFPGGPGVKNPHANGQCMGWTPGPGRPHTQWGNHARAPQLLKPGHPEPMLCNRRRQRKESPCTAARERPLLPATKARTHQQTQSSRNKKVNI